MYRVKETLDTTRQYKKYCKSDNFIKISKNFCTKWKLEPTLAFIYRIIEDADALEYGCYTGSKNDLATITYTNTSTVLRALKRLEMLGFIARVDIFIKDKNRFIVGYKSLGLDCNLPLHIGKPFKPYEKLQMNLFMKDSIIEKWKKDFNILTK